MLRALRSGLRVVEDINPGLTWGDNDWDDGVAVVDAWEPGRRNLFDDPNDDDDND